MNRQHAATSSSSMLRPASGPPTLRPHLHCYHRVWRVTRFLWHLPQESWHIPTRNGFCEPPRGDSMDFIFMLTRDDQTVEDALDVLDEIQPLDLRHIGFKDIGVAPHVLRTLNHGIKAQGAISYL